MNIYNTLYFIEYVKNPIFVTGNNSYFKSWCICSSFKLDIQFCYHYYYHRDFDLPAVIGFKNGFNIEFKEWWRNNKFHRLVGPAIINFMELNKRWVINYNFIEEKSMIK